jgi:hypothetical protein
MERLRSIRSRWYLLVLGLLLTVVAVVLVPPARGVYWVRAGLVLLPPNGESSNPLRVESESLIYFAAAVEREFNENGSGDRAASTDATLYGEGVRQGYAVILNSIGSQWSPGYDRPHLSIQVVDTTPERTRAVFNDIVARLEAIVRNRQLDAQVEPRMMIRTTLAPEDPGITYVAGSERRGQAAIFLIGCCATVLAIRTFEGRRRRAEAVAAKLAGGLTTAGL